MRQGRVFPAGGALIAAVLAALVAGHAHAATGATTERGTRIATAAKSSGASSRRNESRQFTGYVAANDAKSLTVEKRGKQPRTMVFTKHAEMKTTGEIERNARVTVYYRDEGGQTVAHRVVAKPLKGSGGR